MSYKSHFLALPRTSLYFSSKCLHQKLIRQQCTSQSLSSYASLSLQSSSKNNKCRNSKPFSTASHLSKKSGGKPGSARTIPVNEAKTSKIEDPFDFSALEKGVEDALRRLKEDLERIRPGGLALEEVEAVQVQLGVAKKAGGKETVKLGEIAQVVRKGREMVVMVGEKEVSVLPSRVHPTS